MALKKLRQQGTQFLDEAERKLANGVPMVVRLDVVSRNQDAIKATLLMEALGFKRGESVVIKQAPTLTRGPDQLNNALVGTQYDPQAQPGDIIAFSSAYLENDTVMVGRIGARTHCEMIGNVQVIMAAARPSNSKVSTKGASQYLTIADPYEARSIRNLEDAEKLMRDFEENKTDAGTLVGSLMRKRNQNDNDFWPEGMRTGDRGVGEFRPTTEKDITYLIEQLEHWRIFEDNEPITFIPTMNIQVGRDQIRRELNPKILTDGHVRGKLSRQYTHDDGKEAGFRPTVIVISDEEEWAFGGKTGKIKRYVTGIQPANKSAATMPRNLEVPTKNGAKNLIRVQRLFTEEQMAAAARERKSAILPSEPGSSDQTSEPPRARTPRPGI